MRKPLLVLLLSVATFSSFAQKKPKKPLDHQVYDSWETITSERISNDSKWVQFAETPQEGDGKLSIVNLQSKAVANIPRVNAAEFTADSKYSVFLIKPFYKETRAAKIKKKKAEDMPKDTLGIITLGKAGMVKVPRVKSYRMPEKGAGLLVYLSEKEAADTTRKKISDKKTDTEAGVADEPSLAAKNEGTELVLYKLSTGSKRTFKYVTEYSLSNSGKYLAFVSGGSKKDSVNLPGLYWYDIEKDGLRKISSGKGTYKNLVFDDLDQQFAFTAEKTPAKSTQKLYSLYYFSPFADSARVIAGKNSPGMPANWSVNSEGRIFFSKNAQKLYFGTGPVIAPPDSNIVDFEVAKVDVWSYKDEYLQPMQLKNIDRELKRSYMAVIYPSQTELKVIQLAKVDLPDIELGEEGNSEFAILSTNLKYRAELQWTGSGFRDVFRVSTIDGSCKLIASKIRGEASLSPRGNYAIWYNRTDSTWYTMNLRTETLVQLNKGLDVKFYDELNDVPDDPSAFGLAGWTSDEESILIYDRYDIWKFSPSGEMRLNLTNGLGRKRQITFRYVNFNAGPAFRRFSADEPAINSKNPLWLKAFNNITKENGWYLKSLTSKEDPKAIVMVPYSFSKPLISKTGNNFIYTKANYQSSPDLYVSSDFRQEQKLSTINPLQSEYNWGTAELVSWTTPKGNKAQGLLYKPEDFDPAKKYPMIVYFYEKHSADLHTYIAPQPTPSKLNAAFFVSNGYLVFMPDITYEIGYPGRSAEEYVNSGVEELKKNLWLDGSAIGIQGQSWGGYQVAHLITRTNMYAAAWAGAPVVNMTSAYGGIRWESGMSRQFQYEKTQSRIGATLWEKPELYIENSPLFYLPKVNTPVVIMSNDADGAVPWYQGIEMFTALRRLNKPVWMLNYNNEAHNLVQRQNKKDIQIREQQFFDHFLKGKPAPAWMEKGIPAVEKGRNWGFELIESSATDK
ncbi:S9 family peptidase [Flavihumibacter sp. R14]|nr:S9 family peptidase [Flavihumibacter soli]